MTYLKVDVGFFQSTFSEIIHQIFLSIGSNKVYLCAVGDLKNVGIGRYP